MSDAMKRFLSLLGLSLLATGCRDDGTASADTDGSADTDDTDASDDSVLGVSYLLGYGVDGAWVYLTETCRGERCPEPQVDLRVPDFGPQYVHETPVAPCDPSDPPGDLPSEYACKLSPLFALQLDFTQELDRSSFELVRPSTSTSPADQDQVIEPFWWHNGVVRVVGPKATYGGSYRALRAADRTRDDEFEMVSLTCIESLDTEGIDWTPEQLPQLCTPARRRVEEGVFEPNAGRLRHDLGHDLSQRLACGACELITTAQVAPYGIDADGQRRSAVEGTALSCSTVDDCGDFVPSAQRGDEIVPEPYQLAEQPYADRPPETRGEACEDSDACAGGRECVAFDDDGLLCTAGEPGCVEGTCEIPWVAVCEQGSCVDSRAETEFRPLRCTTTTTESSLGPPGTRVSECLGPGDQFTPACCSPELGGAGGVSCLPVDLPGVEPIERHDREDPNGVGVTCVCGTSEPECDEVVERECVAPWGSAQDGYGGEEGEYAVGLVTRSAGPRFEEPSRLVWLRIDRYGGGTPAPDLEACTEPLQDWFPGSSQHDGAFDHSLCSDSTYRIEFATSDAEHHIEGASREVLDGASTFEFFA